MKYKKLPLIIYALFFSCAFINAQEKTNAEKHYFDINKNIELFNTIVKELDMFYVDTLDVEKTIETGIYNMLAGLDPYTQYIPEEDMKDFRFMTTGEYAGIGSVISVCEYEGKIAVRLTDPYENMPAAKAGLKAGDVILEVDGENVVREGSLEKQGRDLSAYVSEKLKGQAGSLLQLKIARQGAKKPIDFKIIREIIQVPAVPYYGLLEDGVGYIALYPSILQASGFTNKSAKEVKDAFLDLKNKGMTSLVFDLRDNGGGMLEEAVQITNMFVPKGEVVLSTKGKIKQAERTYRTTQDPIDLNMPIVVLVNDGSASATEIVSGALQDLDRAVIMGERTFGKGLVQMPRELPYGGSLKITTSKYYIPSGRCVQAIDYTHRDGSGRLTRIPDSLTNVFKTANGREVRDGGGIIPDVKIEEDNIPTMILYMMAENIIFDYATKWVGSHKAIEDINTFSISDEDYNDFKIFVKGKDFKYDQGSEKTLKALKEVMDFEGYTDVADDEFKALEAKLVPDLDRDLDLFREKIIQSINVEIAKRYFYRKGEILESLKNDKTVKQAAELLKDQEAYKKLLQPKETEKLVEN
ncbi:carboxyl-terminal processing protease [Dysgonomonas sp. PH5-45]|nr:MULTISPECIES: S41 family peptidase [unclassified Dysgonomonas]MDH6354257.1 carboxyl-terminal processing protease [Dysgonomonas sp. PH5-45]MDH6387158.1 carboxyl-terminal processing protease [Dysgonomonas sp. PH5-37]